MRSGGSEWWQLFRGTYSLASSAKSRRWRARFWRPAARLDGAAAAFAAGDAAVGDIAATTTSRSASRSAWAAAMTAAAFADRGATTSNGMWAVVDGSRSEGSSVVEPCGGGTYRGGGSRCRLAPGAASGW